MTSIILKGALFALKKFEVHLVFYQMNAYFVVNKKVPGVIDSNLLFIIFIDVGMLYFYSLCLPLVVRAENTTLLTL